MVLPQLSAHSVKQQIALQILPVIGNSDKSVYAADCKIFLCNQRVKLGSEENFHK